MRDSTINDSLVEAKIISQAVTSHIEALESTK